MLEPTDKIKVFISSICGKKKYDDIREKIKNLIEETRIASVYVFEQSGASTSTAKEHYLYHLKECHVCIFLIDNKDGIGDGVQEEIDEANRHKIKSLYYFCDGRKKKETPLQKSLMGAEHAKSRTIHSFAEFENSAKGLLDDIIFIYRKYCKPYEAINENEYVVEQSFSYGSTSFEHTVKKELLDNASRTKKYFTNLFLGYNARENDACNESSHKIDDLACEFLPCFFENKQVNFILAREHKELVETEFEKDICKIVLIRYDALYSYLSGDFNKCIELLEESLTLSKNTNNTSWLCNDILIDLRNVSTWIDASENKLLSESKHQAELDKLDSPLYYPLIDRFYYNFYEKISDDNIAYVSKSPHTIQFGGNLEQYSELLAKSFTVALMYGSITHLNLIYKHIRMFAFDYSEKYYNRNMKLLLLKVSIINYSKKEIDGVIASNDEIIDCMSGVEAMQVYQFSNNRPLAYQRFCSKLEAFRLVAYMLSDEDFNTVWSELYQKILSWVDDSNPVVSLGEHIFDALSAAYLRIDQKHIIEIVIKVVEKKFSRFYDTIFKILSRHLDVNPLDSDLRNKFILILKQLIVGDLRDRNFHSFNSTLVRLKRENPKFMSDLDDLIQVHMSAFYKNEYYYETLDINNIGLKKLILESISDIEKRNVTQGQDGTYIGYSNNPYYILSYTLENNPLIFDETDIEKIFETTLQTLLSAKQTITDKIHASRLLIFILGLHPNKLANKDNYLDSLLNNFKTITTGYDLMSTLNLTGLEFNIHLLLYSFGRDAVSDVIEKLSDIQNDPMSQIMANESFLNFMKSYSKNTTNILTSIILHNAVMWSKNNNTEIRLKATKLLYELIKITKYKRIVVDQIIVLASKDTAIIKVFILRHLNKIIKIDKLAYDYILNKCLNDSNYAIRKIAKDI